MPCMVPRRIIGAGGSFTTCPRSCARSREYGALAYVSPPPERTPCVRSASVLASTTTPLSLPRWPEPGPTPRPSLSFPNGHIHLSRQIRWTNLKKAPSGLECSPRRHSSLALVAVLRHAQVVCARAHAQPWRGVACARLHGERALSREYATSWRRERGPPGRERRG